MRLLFVHADAFAFETTTDEMDGPDSGECADCIVVCVTVETDDTAAVIDPTIEAIDRVADQLKSDQLVVYPTTHLSEDPAEYRTATAHLDRLEEELEAEYDLLSVPPGWGKRVELTRKGHPHAVQSGRVRAGDIRPQQEYTHKRLTSAGEFESVANDMSNLPSGLARIVEYDRSGSIPNRAELSAAFEVLEDARLAHVSEDDCSFTLTPRGTLLRDLLGAFGESYLVEFGAVPVETPLEWLETRSLASEDLPLSLVESETSTGRSLYTLTADAASARTQFSRQVKLRSGMLSTLDISFEPVIHVERDWFETHGTWLRGLVTELGRDAVVAVTTESSVDRPVKIEFVTPGSPLTFDPPMVEIEREPARQFDIEFVDGSDRRRPAVVSSSVPVQSLVVALADRLRTDNGGLPTWLAPTQVRLVPIAQSHHTHCRMLADRLADADVRVDIDDREEPVGRRLEDADAELVPYCAVVGGDELETETLSVFDRDAGSEFEMTVEELGRRVTADTDGFPGHRDTLGRWLSELPEWP